jgi:endonuclease G
VAPQAAKFNQGIELWLGLESYLQEHAAQYRSRVLAFTGPIFSDVDPVYRSVDIRLRFFKVAAFIHEDEVAATGYVGDQTRSWPNCPTCPTPKQSRMALRWARSGRSRPPSGTSPN